MKTTLPVRNLLDQKGHQVWAVTPDTTVYDAIATMAEKGVGALLVISEGQVHGIVSERDYTRKVILQGRSSKDTRVDEIMSSRLVTATPDESVEECMRVMTQNRVRHLPIVDGSGVRGIVSIGDLVKWTISAQQEHIAELKHFIAGSYPG